MIYRNDEHPGASAAEQLAAYRVISDDSPVHLNADDYCAEGPVRRLLSATGPTRRLPRVKHRLGAVGELVQSGRDMCVVRFDSLLFEVPTEDLVLMRPPIDWVESIVILVIAAFVTFGLLISA